MIKMGSKLNEKAIVLFQSDISSGDNKYKMLLNDVNLNAKNIPTLSFNFINEERLRKCIMNANDYSGIIFTSSKAVIAISSALTDSEVSCLINWRDKNNFSVGKATADMAESVLNLDTYGSDSGSSENLCRVIIKESQKYNKPFIFPCSNIRKSTIPRILSEHGIQIEEIVCYETVPNIQFEELWHNLVVTQGLPGIIVFFSPSGVQYCIKTVIDSYSSTAQPKFVAIGPSTEKTLLENNIPCKVAEKPNPESLLSVIKSILDA